MIWIGTVKIQSDHNLHLQLYWNNQIRDLLFWVKPTVCRSLRVLGFSKRVLKHQIIICISFTTHCHILAHTKHSVQHCSVWRIFECVINSCAFQTKYCVFRADTQLVSTVIHNHHKVLRYLYRLALFFLPQLCFHMTRIYVKDENSTKLPFDLFVIIGMCAFLDFFCMNQVMPNVPFMVADFFPEVFLQDLKSQVAGYHRNWLLLRVPYLVLQSGWYFWQFVLGLVLWYVWSEANDLH